MEEEDCESASQGGLLEWDNMLPTFWMPPLIQSIVKKKDSIISALYEKLSEW